MQKKLAEQVFEQSRKYKKAAVMLTGIVPQSEVQMNLFDPEMYTQKQFRLMESMDKINSNMVEIIWLLRLQDYIKKEPVKING